eukprot:758189-Hanusia_phi.AAC.1
MQGGSQQVGKGDERERGSFDWADPSTWSGAKVQALTHIRMGFSVRLAMAKHHHVTAACSVSSSRLPAALWTAGAGLPCSGTGRILPAPSPWTGRSTGAGGVIGWGWEGWGEVLAGSSCPGSVSDSVCCCTASLWQLRCSAARFCSCPSSSYSLFLPRLPYILPSCPSPSPPLSSSFFPSSLILLRAQPHCPQVPACILLLRRTISRPRATHRATNSPPTLLLLPTRRPSPRCSEPSSSCANA